LNPSNADLLRTLEHSVTPERLEVSCIACWVFRITKSKVRLNNDVSYYSWTLCVRQ